MASDNVFNVGTRPRAARKYAIRAVVFQEGEWLCARCLEYDFVVQAKTLPQLSRALQLFIVGHIAVPDFATTSDPSTISGGRPKSTGQCSDGRG